MTAPKSKNVRILKSPDAGPITWPGTSIPKSAGTFAWRSQPSRIIAADKYMQAKSTQVERRATTTKAVLRDNTVTPFGVAILTQADADKSRRIRFSAGSAA